MNLKQDSSTETTINISWNIDISTYQPVKYRITISSVINQEFFCTTSNCVYTVANLSPCSVYTLDLVAIFVNEPNEETNAKKTIEGNTKYAGEPANLPHFALSILNHFTNISFRISLPSINALKIDRVNFLLQSPRASRT